MNIVSNFHTHSRFCDGKGELEEYVTQAIAVNMKYLGFSSHAPLSFETDWAMKKHNFEAYKTEIASLKKKYQDKITIYFGMEVDYIPGILSPQSNEILQMNLDYVIGSIHFLGVLDNGYHWTIDGTVDELHAGIAHDFKGNARQAVEQYYTHVMTMVTEFPPDIIGHLDLMKKNNHQELFFSEDAQWYQDIMDRTLEVIAGTDCIVEVNTGGITRKRINALYPSEWVLKKMLTLNIPITICSDAHRPVDVNGYFPETVQILKEIGFTKYMVFIEGQWKEESLS
jgi:histidinol-phosphatase (PHP family)